MSATFDPKWDAIDTSATLVAEFEGGQLYSLNSLHLVVLNGTYHEMGRQYGHLLKEQILWHFEEIKNDFLVKVAGNNPVDKPAPLFTVEELKAKFMPGYYRAQPYSQKQMVQGACETCGLSLEEMVFMDHMLQAVILAAGNSGCTSAAVWGKASKDGRMYTGRNHDFGKPWRDRLGKIGVIRVMNPTGSGISVAAMTRAGELNTGIDLMNSKGLYFEFNNADNVRPTCLPTNMRATDDLALSLAVDYQSVAELNVVVPNIKSNDALLMLAADPTEARYFELSPHFSVRTDPEYFDGHMTARGNHALHPAWNMDPATDPERTIAFSMKRQSNIVKFLSEDPSTNDDGKMRAFLSKQIIVDGKVSDGAACILEGAVRVEDWTSYQTVTIPAERKMFVRIPTHTPWIEVDLTKYFTNN
mmetsp:Transcript_5378/g.8492  ORF Transcript_5378/g.8492 Transcript_5378/m.8492 type:complete len:415 (-) Transcript_5378:28-1272(-)